MRPAARAADCAASVMVTVSTASASMPARAAYASKSGMSPWSITTVAPSRSLGSWMSLPSAVTIARGLRCSQPPMIFADAPSLRSTATASKPAIPMSSSPASIRATVESEPLPSPNSTARPSSSYQPLAFARSNGACVPVASTFRRTDTDSVPSGTSSPSPEQAVRSAETARTVVSRLAFLPVEYSCSGHVLAFCGLCCRVVAPGAVRALVDGARYGLPQAPICSRRRDRLQGTRIRSRISITTYMATPMTAMTMMLAKTSSVLRLPMAITVR